MDRSHLAQNGYTPAGAAAVQGGDIVIIGGISNKLPFQMVVKSSIASAEQLRSKKIAISRFGSSTDINVAKDYPNTAYAATRRCVAKNPEV